MLTYVICSADGNILSVSRSEELPNETEREMNIPADGFLIDITGQEDFDVMDILDIHNNYKADVEKKNLVKVKKG
jgi:hypothetical protein